MEVSDTAMNKIFQSLLQGQSQVWLLVGDDESNTIYAMGITCFSTEAATDTKNLLIYSLSGYRSIPEDLWLTALNGIKDFAKAHDCFKIIAFTQVNRIVDIAKLVGGNTSTSLIYWEV